MNRSAYVLLQNLLRNRKFKSAIWEKIYSSYFMRILYIGIVCSPSIVNKNYDKLPIIQRIIPRLKKKKKDFLFKCKKIAGGMHRKFLLFVENITISFSIYSFMQIQPYLMWDDLLLLSLVFIQHGFHNNLLASP